MHNFADKFADLSAKLLCNYLTSFYFISMKRIKFVLAACIGMACGMTMHAAETDGEGYPVMYLTGDFIQDQWSFSSDYKFTREGETYTLHVDNLPASKQFKITNDDWTLNYGGDSQVNGEVVISESITVIGKQNGANFSSGGMTDLTITFQLNRQGSTNINFIVNGKTPEVVGISGTLPVLYINVRNEDGSFNNEIISKDLDHKNYFQAEYWLDLNGCSWMEEEGAKSIGSEAEPLPLEIKARGNWTRRGFSKKPFKLKLGEKQKMLGMTKSKHFALLAHADDSHGYLRNFTGFNLGRRIGLPWTPAQQPVEVVINGDYRGLYFLTESIRIEKDRINITELDDNVSDPSIISGGYLVELDNYDEENQIQMDEKSCVSDQYLDLLRITFDTPEVYSPEQRRFVTDQFTAMNDAVGANSDELWRYLDLDDAARYYIVEEIISHTESYHGSTYLFRDHGADQKWHFSPLWDCGNAYSGPTDGFLYDHDAYGNTWIPSIRTNDTFNEKVRRTWLWFMSTRYNGLIDDIDSYVSHISAAAKSDRIRWAGQQVPDGGQEVCDNSDMVSRRNRVVNHLEGKINWLKGHFGDFTTEGTDIEPERDTTPAAPLPDYVGFEKVSADIDSTDLPAEYFNLQGIRVNAPSAGEIYIERRGTSATLRIAH